MKRLRLKSFILISFLLLHNLPSSLSIRRSPTTSSNSGNKKQFDSDNYYTVLGLSKKAEKKKIKSAYRKLALKYHPDKVKDGDDPEKHKKIFVKISLAYAVLGDKKKKKIYDQYGKNGLDAFEKGQDPAAAGFGSSGGGDGQGFDSQGFGGQGFNFQSGGSRRQGFNFQSGGSGRQTQGGFDPFSMFENMFAGQQTGGKGQQQQKKNPHPDIFPKGKSRVARLGKPKFPNKKSKNMWLIMFYANDNKESREVSKIYESLAAQSNLPYKVGAVDCRMSPREKIFCADRGIDSAKLPSFSLVIDGKIITYADYDYRSSSSKAFHTFCMDNIPKKYINNINNIPQMEERILFQSASNPNPNIKNRSSLPAVLLVTDKYETSSMFYSIAYYFRNDFIFGESRAKNLKLSQAFAVKTYPTLIAFVPLSSGRSKEKYNDKYGFIRYTGSLKKEKIITWLGKIKIDIAKGKKNSRRKTEL